MESQYDKGKTSRPKVLDLLLEYESLVNGAKDYGDAYREILEEQPLEEVSLRDLQAAWNSRDAFPGRRPTAGEAFTMCMSVPAARRAGAEWGYVI